jgi:Ca2+-binding RTX toxin-like protein
VAVADNVTTQEDTPVSIDILNNDSDILDGDTLYIDTFDIFSSNGGTITRDQRGTPHDATRDRIEGGVGHDTVEGGDGNDQIFGNPGNDILFGNSGEDIIRGDEDNDILYGGGDRDRVFGDTGDDFLLGEGDADILVGGEGDDTLDGGAGADKVYGNNGADQFILRVGEGSDTIFDFNPGEDILGLAGGLSFDQLNLMGMGSTTLIRMNGSGELLAMLIGVQATQVSVADFVVV